MFLRLLCIALVATVPCLAVPVDNAEPVPAKVVPVAVPVPQEASAPVVDVTKEQTPILLEKGDIRSARSYVLGNDVHTEGQPLNQVEESLLRKLNSKCAQKDASSCAMLKLVTYMNRLLKKANIDVAENIEITQTTAEVEVKAEDVSRSLNHESDEAQLAELMTAKLLSFVRSRALRLRVIPNMDAVITSNPDSEGNLNLGMSVEHVQPEEGRGKKNSGLLAAIVMKFGMLGALAFKGLVLLVGKALLVSKIALLLAVVIGLKKLFSHQKHVTYEVVAQPHHSHSHVEHVEHGHGGGGGGGGGGGDSYSSGWGRNINVAPVGRGDGQNIAYRAHTQKQ